MTVKIDGIAYLSKTNIGVQYLMMIITILSLVIGAITLTDFKIDV